MSETKDSTILTPSSPSSTSVSSSTTTASSAMSTPATSTTPSPASTTTTTLLTSSSPTIAPTLTSTSVTSNPAPTPTPIATATPTSTSASSTPATANVNSPTSIALSDQSNAQKSPDAVKLFVGQIPKTMNEDELRPLFSIYGNIYELTVIRDKITSAHRGCAFLTYATKAEADYAIKCLHNIRILAPMTNPLQIKYADGEMDRMEHKLFVGMIPKTASEEDLRPIFQPYGKIEEISVLRGPNGIGKGCAFVKYSSREEALAAMNYLNGQHKMEGGTQPIVVKFADTPRQKEQRRQQQLLQQQQQLLQSSLSLAAAQPAYSALYSQLAAANPANPYIQSQLTGVASSYLNYQQPSTSGTNNVYSSSPSSTSSTAANTAAAAIQAYLSSYTGLSHIPALQSSFSSNAPQIEGPPGSNLFIYHLPQDFTDANLALIFAPFGNVISSKVFIDKNTGQSKCFGFVSYDSAEAAQNAIANMNGFQIGNKRLKVQVKRMTTQGSRPY